MKQPLGMWPAIRPRSLRGCLKSYMGCDYNIELSTNLDKSVHRLEQIDTERPCSLKTLPHASLVASTIAAVLARRHNLNTRPQQASASRTEAPLHIRLLALPIAASAQFIAHAFELNATGARRPWNKIAELLRQTGTDPNSRRRLSVLDQLQGWKRHSCSW